MWQDIERRENILKILNKDNRGQYQYLTRFKSNQEANLSHVNVDEEPTLFVYLGDNGEKDPLV